MAQGRKVTTEQTEQMLQRLREGSTRSDAALSSGFSRPTFYRLIEDETLLAAVEKAEAEAAAIRVKIIADAAVTNWTAAAWWLERRRPDDFGRRDRVDVTFNLRKFAEERGLDPDEVMAEADAILSARNARG